MSITALASAFVSPPPAAKNAPEAILAGTRIDPTVLKIIRTSCQNCHSANTQWPWYSHLAPLSWMLERDVHEARTQMDLSRWDDYDPREKMRLLATIGSVVRNHIMPPRRYTAIHAEAKLTEDQIRKIYLWTRAARMEIEGG